MKIYFDTCCYNRPFDGYAAEKPMMEVAAIKAAVKGSGFAGFAIIGSFVTEREIDKIPDIGKWKRARGYYNSTITERISQTVNINARAQSLQAQGLKEMDSFHLACAEAANADFLLTTDTRFVSAYERLIFSFVTVMNPIDFLPEVKKWLR